MKVDSCAPENLASRVDFHAATVSLHGPFFHLSKSQYVSVPRRPLVELVEACHGADLVPLSLTSRVSSFSEERNVTLKAIL